MVKIFSTRLQLRLVMSEILCWSLKLLQGWRLEVSVGPVLAGANLPPPLPASKREWGWLRYTTLNSVQYQYMRTRTRKEIRLNNQIRDTRSEPQLFKEVLPQISKAYPGTLLCAVKTHDTYDLRSHCSKATRPRHSDGTQGCCRSPINPSVITCITRPQEPANLLPV